MAFTFDVNAASQAWNLQFFRLKEGLKTAGWTVEKSGTGTAGTYNSTGDSLTTGASMATTNCWFVIKKPGGEQRFCIQLNGSGSTRIKYALAAFSGGSPSATQVPTASGESLITGSNTDASPVYTSLMDSTNRTNILIGDATENYAFLLMSHSTGVSGNRSCFLFDAMRSGTYPAEDLDPHVIHINGLSTGITNVGDLSNMSGPYGSLYYPSGTRRLVRMAYVNWYATGPNAVVLPGGIGSDVMTGNEIVFPAYVARTATSNVTFGGGAYFKGAGRLIHWLGSSKPFGDTISIGGTKNYLVIGGTTTPTTCNVVIPWNGTDLTI